MVCCLPWTERPAIESGRKLTFSKLMMICENKTYKKVSISVIINLIIVHYNIFVDRAVFTITICNYTAIQGARAKNAVGI